MNKKLNIKKLAYYMGCNTDYEVLQQYYNNDELDEYYYNLIKNFITCEDIKLEK